MLLAAGLLTFLLGLIHSIMGEVLIFKRLRSSGVIPTNGGSLLKERHVRILWASWHLVTVFGWGLAVILCWFSMSASAEVVIPSFIASSVVISMVAGSALVLIGTTGKHPGWLVLAAIAILTLLGS